MFYWLIKNQDYQVCLNQNLLITLQIINLILLIEVMNQDYLLTSKQTDLKIMEFVKKKIFLDQLVPQIEIFQRIVHNRI